MSWHGSLTLRYSRDGERTVAHDRHEGPLRVLKALYPEGPGICHHVLVHPPGGIVGGDRLEIDLRLDGGTHALITTPGATRFYRSAGAVASQHASLHVGDGARLEWLPLETIAHSGCRAENGVRFELERGAQMIGWDLLALGLPAADAPFDAGEFTQQIEWPGHWLERGRIAADDLRLLASPLGLGGRRAMLTLWFAAHAPWPTAERDALLDASREAAFAHGLAAQAGATAPDPRLLVLRALAPCIEPLLALAVDVRAAWRASAWQLDGAPPRVWRT